MKLTTRFLMLFKEFRDLKAIEADAEVTRFRLNKMAKELADKVSTINQEKPVQVERVDVTSAIVGQGTLSWEDYRKLNIHHRGVTAFIEVCQREFNRVLKNTILRVNPYPCDEVFSSPSVVLVVNEKESLDIETRVKGLLKKFNVGHGVNVQRDRNKISVTFTRVEQLESIYKQYW